jgi:hypothetical protein
MLVETAMLIHLYMVAEVEEVLALLVVLDHLLLLVWVVLVFNCPQHLEILYQL